MIPDASIPPIHGVYGMISAIILAAGESKRMGQPKMLLPWGEVTVLGQVISTYQAAGVEDVLVVTGGAREQVEGIVRQHGARSVFNEQFAGGGMLSSLQCGLQFLSDGGGRGAGSPDRPGRPAADPGGSRPPGLRGLPAAGGPPGRTELSNAARPSLAGGTILLEGAARSAAAPLAARLSQPACRGDPVCRDVIIPASWPTWIRLRIITMPVPIRDKL